MLRKLTPVIFGTIGLVTIGFGTGAIAQTGDAAKIMAAMRAAIGGADKIAAVKSLTAEGLTRAPMGQSTTESQTAMAVALPDKYVARRLATPVLGTYLNAGFNGNGVISEVEITKPMPESRHTIRARGMRWPVSSLTPEQ